MTGWATIVVASFGLFVALVTGWMLRPQFRQLDGARWMLAWVATLLRGQVEAEGGDASAWADRVQRTALFHPSAPQPDRLLERNDGAQDVGARAQDVGARALWDAVNKIDDALQRWRWLFEREENGRAARLGDPEELGDAYRPVRWLGPGTDWESIAAGGAVPEPLVARLREAGPHHWALVGETPEGHPTLVDALARWIGPAAHRIPNVSATPAMAEAFRGKVLARRPGAPGHEARAVGLLEALHAIAPEPSDRLIIVVVGEAVHAVLDALLTSDGLRDQVDAVCAIHAPILGDPRAEYPYDEESCRAFVSRWFAHEPLDREATRLCSYFSLRFMTPGHSPPGFGGLPAENTRFPTLDDAKAPRRFIESVDLGAFRPSEDFPSDLIALALWGTIAGWVRMRRL